MVKVSEWWSQLTGQEFAGLKLSKKLQMLKEKIKEWNREVFGKLDSNRNSITEELEA